VARIGDQWRHDRADVAFVTRDQNSHQFAPDQLPTLFAAPSIIDKHLSISIQSILQAKRDLPESYAPLQTLKSFASNLPYSIRRTNDKWFGMKGLRKLRQPAEQIGE